MADLRNLESLGMYQIKQTDLSRGFKMRNFHNIESEKSPFGNYRLGYAANGIVFKITGEPGHWKAEIAPKVPANVGKALTVLHSNSLAELSAALTNLT